MVAEKETRFFASSSLRSSGRAVILNGNAGCAVMRTRRHHHVVEVYERTLPAHASKDYDDVSLKGARIVLQSERHAYKPD